MTIRSHLGHDLDLEFSRSNAKLAISLPKMVRLPHNEKQTHQLNSRPQMWPSDLTLAVTLTLNFKKVKYEICYISTKSGLIATKQKANTSIWILGIKCDNGFDLGHDIDIWIFKVICDLDHLVTKVRCKDLPDSDRGDFRCRRAVDSSSFSWEWTCCISVLINDRKYRFIFMLLQINSELWLGLLWNVGYAYID